MILNTDSKRHRLVFLIRHGECGKNIHSIIDKNEDHSPKFVSKFTRVDKYYDSKKMKNLTPNGIHQCVLLSRWLSSSKYIPDKIWSSNKTRAIETSTFVKLMNVYKPEIEQYKDLDEVSIGKMDEETGRIETFDELMNRVEAIKQRIEDEPDDVKTIMIFSHSATISAITMSIFTDKFVNHDLKLHPMNTSISILLYDIVKKKCDCLVFNSIEHLLL